MRLFTRIACSALMCSVAMLLAGCDGIGLVPVKSNAVSGDSTPADDSSTDGSTDSSDSRFAGTWVASYGDDFITSRTDRGIFDYATVLTLTHSDTTVTGSGSMYRFARQGTDAWQQLKFTVSGTASGADATLTLRPSATGYFDAKPVWYLRIAGSKMAGLYHESSTTGDLIRAGHATFYEVSTGDIDGAWSAAVSDRYAVTGYDRLEHTASMSLAQDTDSTFEGVGSFYAQRNTESAVLDYNITLGGIDSPDVGFVMGGLDLADTPINWLGFFTGSSVVAAYAQLDASDSLIRAGHATWYRSPDPTTAAVSRDWVVAFSDAVTADSTAASDYLALMSLDVQDGGEVTGSGTIRVEENDGSSLESFTVYDGSLVGSLLHVEMRNSSRRLIWDLRVGSSVMVGTYRQLNGSGTEFVSRGAAEWRVKSTASQKGTWTASYYDTYGTSEAENTQLGLVTVSAVDSDSVLSGTGGLRFAGETSRRLFTLEGDASGDEIIWNWDSQDLFGAVTWHLRQAGNYLYGTYLNEDSSGNLEFRGSVMWVRTSQTDEITE